MTNAYLTIVVQVLEKEATAELQHFATQYDWQGYVKSKADKAVLFCGQDLPTTGKTSANGDLVLLGNYYF
ncbi:MAG: hypothetical protein U1E99_08840 [Agitococcus sp.]